MGASFRDMSTMRLVLVQTRCASVPSVWHPFGIDDRYPEGPRSRHFLHYPPLRNLGRAFGRAFGRIAAPLWGVPRGSSLDPEAWYRRGHRRLERGEPSMNQHEREPSTTQSTPRWRVRPLARPDITTRQVGIALYVAVSFGVIVWAAGLSRDGIIVVMVLAAFLSAIGMKTEEVAQATERLQRSVDELAEPVAEIRDLLKEAALARHIDAARR